MSIKGKHGFFVKFWLFVKFVIVVGIYCRKTENQKRVYIVTIFGVHDLQLRHNFLRGNKVITRNQSAFQKLYSTEAYLLCSTDSWYENIDNKKAFDTVDHRIMAEKLMAYGIVTGLVTSIIYIINTT